MNAKNHLKIALVSDAVLPFHQGGKEARIDHLAKALVARGHDVTIYTMKWWDDEGSGRGPVSRSAPKSFYEYIKYFWELPRRLPPHFLSGRDDIYEADGLKFQAISRLYPLYNGKRRSFVEGIMFGLACLRMVKYDYDLVEVDHMPYFPLFSMKLVRLIQHKPFFATWHEVVGLKAWQGYIGKASGTVAYLLERIGVMMPDRLIAVSTRTQDLLLSELHRKPGKVTLVSNGIDYYTIAAAPVAKKLVDIIYTGRLVKHKHVDMLIRAVAELAKTRPKVKALIIGDGPERQRLEKLVVELGLQKNVTLAGRLRASADVFSHMKAAKVFVSPSTREGFGITILEAYACGLRVVTVDHPDNAGQYLVRDGEGMVCKLDVESLRNAIEGQLAGADKRLAIDGADFDWSRSVDALEAAYRSAVS